MIELHFNCFYRSLQPENPPYFYFRSSWPYDVDNAVHTKMIFMMFVVDSTIRFAASRHPVTLVAVTSCSWTFTVYCW